MNRITKRLFGAAALLGATLALPTAAHATRGPDGYSNWSEVGVATMRDFQNGNPEYQEWARAQALSQLGLNAYEVREVLDAMKNGTAERGVIHQGNTFKSMSYYSRRQGRVIMLSRVRLTAAGEYEVSRVRLANGRVIVIVDECNNVGEEESAPPPPPPPPPPLPPPTITTTVTFDIPPVAPPVPVVPTQEADSFCNNPRLNAVIGAELELNEGMARSGYGAWGVYCMRRLRNGDQIGFGLAGQGAVYAGDPGNGHFGGHLVAGGVGMMYVDKDGQDLEAKLMIGDYLSTYGNDDGYRQREHHPMLAFSVAHNDYSPRLRGETSMPERQLFGMVGLPIGGGCTSSWQGTPLEGCSNMSLYYNAGVRQWINNNVYVQAGILGEIRSGDDLFSCSLRVGYANNRRTIGVHAGVNACSGGIVPAVGIWYDLGTDLRLKRAARRAASVSVDAGEGREATSTFSGRRLSSTRRDRE